MSEQTYETPETTVEHITAEEYSQDSLQDKWLCQLKRLGLAAVGAVALAQDELELFVKRLVERGELAESESRKWMTDFFERSRQQTKQTVNIVENGIESGWESSLGNVEKILSKMSIPTKADVEELSKKVDDLALKIGELNKSNQPQEQNQEQPSHNG